MKMAKAKLYQQAVLKEIILIDLASFNQVGISIIIKVLKNDWKNPKIVLANKNKLPPAHMWFHLMLKNKFQSLLKAANKKYGMPMQKKLMNHLKWWRY